MQEQVQNSVSEINSPTARSAYWLLISLTHRLSGVRAFLSPEHELPAKVLDIIFKLRTTYSPAIGQEKVRNNKHKVKVFCASVQQVRQTFPPRVHFFEIIHAR